MPGVTNDYENEEISTVIDRKNEWKRNQFGTDASVRKIKEEISDEILS